MHRILDIVKYIVKIENGWSKIIKWYHGDIGIILMKETRKFMKRRLNPMDTVESSNQYVSGMTVKNSHRVSLYNNR